ncbi:aminotransferase class V-fold PLP-dependent enzyme [Pseudoxanthomonas helianthi]|uniref:Aminotransferase class V-fold PLP-dependent enzyme n=1 Tax=Pseudoxanthomonas helianthi TaxID=1453541 RepID=A0A940WWH4_9GAMM|nr:aminotransferase class V-fold PLP-dependent enzyme [Pseudoxanthomonas helianthi]MBP3982973.1 aminotransferase class V-fold PLP-dependent enzyme [Pseudoxanthomonas helianthi]
MNATLSRRRFLAVPAALGAAALLPGDFAVALAEETPRMPDLSDWSKVRGQFQLDPDWMHFASFFIASHPAPVRDAIDGWRRAMDRNPFQVIEQGMFEDEAHNIPLQVRAAIARYLGGGAEDIALTRSTTEGLALVYHGLPLKAGDEVLATTHDHYSHHESIRLATRRAGATMRRVPLFDEAAQASTGSMIERLLAAVKPATRVVGLTWVHSSSGMRLPIREIAAALKQRHPDVLLVVDGVHGLGSTDETVATMGADYFCAGCHKWMFAPRGTGLVWASAQNWARLTPTIPDFSDFESYDAWSHDRAPATPNNAARMSPGGFHAFEHQWAMGAAFGMHERMGRSRVAARIRALNDQLKAGLSGIGKVRIHTPMSGDLSAGLVAFEIDGVKTDDVVKRLLERRIIASSSPYAVSYPRLAPSLINTPEEVDRAIAAVREIAA